MLQLQVNNELIQQQ